MRATLGVLFLVLGLVLGPARVALAATEPGEEIGVEHPKGDDMQIVGVVNFEVGHAELLPAAKAILNRVAKQLADNPAQKIELAGHTDNSGAELYNAALSDRRAHSVGTYLMNHGIAAERLSMIGYGIFQPVDSNETEAGRARNRRTEVKISP